MKRKRFSTEQIVAVLRQHEMGMAVSNLIRQVGITEQTFYLNGRFSRCKGVDELAA